jgi:hypothetical protein
VNCGGASDPVGQILKHNFISCTMEHLGMFSLALRGITTTLVERLLGVSFGGSNKGQKLETEVGHHIMSSNLWCLEQQYYRLPGTVECN